MSGAPISKDEERSADRRGYNISVKGFNEHGEPMMSLAKAARHYNIGISIVRVRVNNGWDPLKALTTPVTGVFHPPVYVEIGGERLNLREAHKKYGKVSYAQVRGRIKAGWDPVQAITEPPKTGIYKKAHAQ